MSFIGLDHMHFGWFYLQLFVYPDEKCLEFIFINLILLVQFELEIVSSFIKHFCHLSFKKYNKCRCIGELEYSSRKKPKERLKVDPKSQIFLRY